MAQECFSGSEIDAATAKAVETAAQQYFNMSAQGDVAGLKADAIPEVAANFGGIERAVVADKQFFAEGKLAETQDLRAGREKLEDDLAAGRVLLRYL